MFTYYGTYIIGFSAASKHMTMVPERATMIRLELVMCKRGTGFGKMLARWPRNRPFNYEFFGAPIQDQLIDKRGAASFRHLRS